MKTILIHLFLLLTGAICAQTTITGKVLTNDGQPLAFASVLLVQPTDSSLVIGAVTEDDGRYEMIVNVTGNYLLSAQMLGYQTSYRPVLIPITGQSVNQPAQADKMVGKPLRRRGNVDATTPDLCG